MLFAAIVPAFLLARLEERPFGAYGLPRARHSGSCSGRSSLGIGALTLLLFALHGAGGFEVDRLALHGRAFWNLPVLGLYFLVVSFCRRVLPARLHPVHPNRDHRVLAGGGLAFHSLRRASPS